jgi:hypothetical protein
MMGSSWLPTPVQTMVDQRTPLGPSTPQSRADVPDRTAPQPSAPLLTTGPPRRTWPTWLLPLLAATVLIPSLTLVALGFSQGQSGACGLFAAGADAAMLNQHRPSALAAEACSETPRTQFLLGLVGVALSVSLTVMAIRLHRKH